MQHSSLLSFLNAERTAGALWLEIQAEVRECLAACAKKGGFGHVILTKGPEAKISRKQVMVLLTALINGGLPLEAASYIADAIIMCDDFRWDDKSVREALYFLSDESQPITRAEVEEARGRLAASS